MKEYRDTIDGLQDQINDLDKSIAKFLKSNNYDINVGIHSEQFEDLVSAKFHLNEAISYVNKMVGR